MQNSEKIQVFSNPKRREYFQPQTTQEEYYSPDSGARQIALPEPEYFPERQRRPNVSRPPARKKGKRHKLRKKQDPDFVYDIQARVWHNLLSYAVLLAFFGGLALVLALNAQFDYSRLGLESDRAHLAALQSGNAARAGEIYATLDLVRIEQVAIEQLGMMPPEDFQLVEVVVSPQSFFSAVQTDTPAVGGFSFDRFWNILFGLDDGGQE